MIVNIVTVRNWSGVDILHPPWRDCFQSNNSDNRLWIFVDLGHFLYGLTILDVYFGDLCRTSLLTGASKFFAFFGRRFFAHMSSGSSS